MSSADGQRELLQLRSELDDWRKGSRASVQRLAQALDAGSPETAGERPYTLLAPVHDLLAIEDLRALPDDDFYWLLTHVIAFTAEYVIHGYGGEWSVDDDPESPSFKKFVLSGFPAPVPPGRRIDVGRYVTDFFDGQPPGMNYAALIASIVESIPELE